MNRYLLILLSFLSFQIKAQKTLDPVAHPKFQTAVTFPNKINLSSTSTNVFQMAQTTQSLGLVNPTTNAQLTTTVWGYGPVSAPSYPGPTLVANSHVPVNVEWRNNLPKTHLLPVDSTYHIHLPASGIPTVVHLHGSHVEAVSDGQPDAWYNANYAQKGIGWTKSVYTYDNSQEGSILWYHDHALGATRLNVYAGLAGMYLLNDANDQALNLPRGNYDRELMVQDKMFTETGQLFLPTDPMVVNGGMPEFFGDFILVNGKVWPFMNVEPRKYRFRVLNASDSRVYVFKLSNNASFLQIGSDGGKFNTPKSLTQLTLAPGERSDIIVDFSSMNGQQVTLLNLGPDAPYGNPASVQADPATTGKVMQFRVNQPLNTAIANAAVSVTTNLRPTLGVIPTLGTPQKTRKLGLFEGADDMGRILPMLGIIDPAQPTLNGSLLWHDKVTENVNLNDTEIWEIYNTTADAHPIHLHLVSFQILSKQAFTGTLTPKTQAMHDGGIGEGAVLSNIVLTGTATNNAPNDLGWKDTHILLPGQMMRIKARFDRTGSYVWHCHILSHEDHDMMRRLVVAVPNPCAKDVTPPSITCPANINTTTVNTTATVTYPLPQAKDNCSTPSVSIMSGLKSGSTFPIGTNTVTYMAMDAANNMSTCSFNVTVTSACSSFFNSVVTEYYTNKSWHTGSSVSVDLGTSLTLSANPNGLAYYQWTGPNGFAKAGAAGGDVLVSSAITADQEGNYTVTLKDTKGCVATKTITVNINNSCKKDAIPPVFKNCPTDFSVPVSIFSYSSPASWKAPTATDNCSTASVAKTYGINNGTYVVPGSIHRVSYTATDAKKNKSYCNFYITAYRTNSHYLLNNDNLAIEVRAEPNRVLIEWANNTGSKNDYFALEKINNSTGLFEQLTILKNSTHNDTIAYYQTYDNTPTEGHNTYRIKVYFQDGTSKVSESKSVHFTHLSGIDIFPNPATDFLNIDVSNYQNEAIELYLYNALGQLRWTTQLEKITNPILELDISNQPTGTYWVKIKSKNKRDLSKSIVIAH